MGLRAQDYIAFGSAHPGNFQMAWCDGSVSGIEYDIELQLHRENCSRGSSENAPTLLPPPPEPPRPPDLMMVNRMRSFERLGSSAGKRIGVDRLRLNY